MPLKRCLVLGALAATLLALPAPASAADSTTCQPAIVEGTFAGQRLRLAVDQPSSGQVRLCFRVADAAGGAITIGGPSGGIGVPSIDGDDTACATTSPNSAPGPHPLADGAVAGQRVYLDLYRGNGEVWVCLGVGSQRFRLIVPVAGVGLPGVTYEPDPDIGGLPGACDVAPQACEPPPDPDPIYVPSVCELLGGCTFTCNNPTSCTVIRIVARVLGTPIVIDP